jgi:hypothetical protein
VNGFIPRARLKWLRLMLAVLLPLHAGFAQAAMVMPAEAASVAVEVAQPLSADDAAMMSGMPCHTEAESAPAPDHDRSHDDGCCKTGSCHCAAACGLPFAVLRLAPQPGQAVTPCADLPAPTITRPPDLRPPIG